MKYPISRRAASLTPSLTLAVDAKAKQMRAEGIDVVGFGAGEPDFPTPQHIKDAASQAWTRGFTKYHPQQRHSPSCARRRRKNFSATTGWPISPPR